MNLTLGSLFDGSGTAPLAASLCGITPVWASEIEPYPIRVTTKRFPNMLHLGSITDIDGAKVKPVDIICGGSPCQDLSVAGKQAGLDGGTRSHLFYEMTRIIKEMRKASNGKYPRFIVWENVPGAFSSNNGRDFLSVLQSFAEIAEADVYVPEPERKADKLVWRYAGEVVGGGWSIAWRTVDAQYWGVPQRRRRIYLVVDLDSERAGEILFEREGVRGYFAKSGAHGQGIAADAERSAGTDDREGEIGCLNPWDYQSKRVFKPDGIFPTLQSGERSGQNQQSVLIPYTLKICSGCEGGGKGALIQEDKSVTLATNNDQYLFQPMSLREENRAESVVKNAIRAGESKSSHAVVYATDIGFFYSLENVSPTLLARMYKDPHLITYKGSEIYYIVRRLTPLECSRLQGFPDYWELDLETPSPTDEDITFWSEVFETHRKVVSPGAKPKTRNQIIKWLQNPYSDSASYKMWGNGMALPNMLHVMKGIVNLCAAKMDKEN